MSREWKPGDVAIIQDERGVSRVAVHGDVANPRMRHHWHYDESGIGRIVNPARPLVVIDPELDEDLDRICKALVEKMYAAGDERSAANGVHPATMQAALRSLLAPERPAEPMGLGAVVEDEDGQRWVRAGRSHDGRLEDNWRGVDGGIHSGWWAKYDYIKAVRVLSEGVTQ